MISCVFSSDQDDDQNCAAIAPAPERNPWTGQCETQSDPCEGAAPVPQAPMGPTAYLASLGPWAACYGTCEGQDEASCRNDPSCQTAYLDQDFWGCWELNSTPLPTSDGDCASLEALSCSTRNDCVPVYNYFQSPPDPTTGERTNWTVFAHCDAEDSDQPPPLSCANVLCNLGTHCEEQPGGPTCVPDQQDPGSCYGDTFCDGLIPDCPDGTLPGIANGCWTGYCIPQDACEPAPSCQSVANEATCINRQDCLPLYVACEPNENCQYQYWGCTDN